MYRASRHLLHDYYLTYFQGGISSERENVSSLCRNAPPNCRHSDDPSTQWSRWENLLTVKAKQVGALAYAIWLFTFSDLKTIVGPSSAFGLLNAMAVSSFKMVPLKNIHGFDYRLLLRAPRVVFWVWSNLLPFAIDNQRQPKAIQEDLMNKPWRPMSSAMMTARMAKLLMVMFYALAVTNSVFNGGSRQCLSLIVLGVWYNHLGGSDATPIIRNMINALGYVCYISGAMEVALQESLPLTPVLARWLLTLGCVIFTTVHSQDMYDQAGDRLRHRRTVPLTIGDGPARWTLALPISFWGWFCPYFWRLPLPTYLVSMTLGTVIAFRTLARRSVEDDKLTFRLWNVWISILYTLPLWTVFCS